MTSIAARSRVWAGGRRPQKAGLQFLVLWIGFNWTRRHPWDELGVSCYVQRVPWLAVLGDAQAHW